MRENVLMPAATPRLALSSVLLGTVLLGALTACSGSSGSGSTNPNSAGRATVVPGNVPTQGEGSAGGITVTGVSIVRSGSKLTVSGQIHNDESAADELVSVGSEVTATLTLNPALRIPAGDTVSLGGAHQLVLQQNARLEPGGTVVLSLQFTHAGPVQVFSSFLEAS